ncbi:hypothetical protein HKW91_00815 [Pseudomonas aeruginosa]|nr:hypothetical protein [Pseudomonas aeruginosa]
MNTVESIANDGIEHARYCTEQARWLNALGTSICDALVGGKASPDIRADRAKELASLIRYLAHNLIHYSESRASEMEKELAALQAQGGAQ